MKFETQWTKSVKFKNVIGNRYLFLHCYLTIKSNVSPGKSKRNWNTFRFGRSTLWIARVLGKHINSNLPDVNLRCKISLCRAVSSPGDVEAVLLVNIKGCGYPPVVDCKNFTRELGYEGAKFPCHYSRVNGSIVMANYNREAQVAIIMHFFAAPFVVTLATSVVLCVMHCDCRCTPPPRHPPRGMRRSRGNDLR